VLRQISSSQRLGGRFSTRILLPVALVTTVAIGLAAFSLFWAVRQSDEVSVERQLRTTQRTIGALVEELAQQQEMVAVWNDAVEKLRERPLNLEWIDGNLGPWLYRTFGQDQVYILDADDEAMDATVDGKRVPIGEYDLVRASLENIILGLRGDPRSGHHGHAERTANSPYLTSGKAVRDAHVIQLLGRPAAVSVMKIVTETDSVVQEPGTEPLLVSIRFLDDTFLKRLSERSLIEGLRFSTVNTPTDAEVSVPLRSDEGETIGYFIWQPELPGTKILSAIGPTTALVCALMFIVMTMLVRSLHSSMAKLEATVFELRASEAHAQHLAFHDTLTGLPNRALFHNRFDRALARVERGEGVALLMLDLDRFKHVNDTLGHHAGDNLIRELGRRLSGLLRNGDTIARLGGDEFAIIQPGIRGRKDVEALCNRILEAVRKPFDLHGSQAFVGVSIGVALAPDAGTDPIELQRKADIALYHAKNQGRDCHRYFEPAMDESVKRRATIEEELREALASGQGLKVHYQPQVAAAGRPVIGLEALVRWQHPSRGLIAPDQFLPIAEETGLILQLGDMVLRQACAISLRWPELFVAVNLSPAQFRSACLADRIIRIVHESGTDPHRIELEVTEGVLLGDALTRDTLRRLRDAGFRIALDDFGSGHSSLSYLRRYEVDKIKIDRSFVQHLGHAIDQDAAAIVKAITTLGHTIGLTVTAEGVETEDQRRFLATTGCTELQGHLFARALPEDKIAGLITSVGGA
jgi:diguanylate cyclase (GGDEF)-like protein